jgi:hypothetical protein
VSESDLGVAKADQARERKIAALSQDYPAWRIRYVRLLGPRWWATRYAVLTDAQRASGLVPSIAREDVVSLMMELAVQDEIAHRSGYATGELPPGVEPSELNPRTGG